jgi:hypothetical protein
MPTRSPAIVPFLAYAWPRRRAAAPIGPPPTNGWCRAAPCWRVPRAVVPVQVTAATAHVRIADRAATTTLRVRTAQPRPAATRRPCCCCRCPTGRRCRRSRSSAVRRTDRADPVARRGAAPLRRDHRKLRDPALLEFAGLHCLRSSVFPVPAGGRQKVRLAYDHVLDAHGDQVDYVLPRSEMLGGDAPWTITVELAGARADRPATRRATNSRSRGAANARVRCASRRTSQRDPGSFRLCYTTVGEASQPTAALFAYPDPTIGGGYFLLLASAPRARRSADRGAR